MIGTASCFAQALSLVDRQKSEGSGLAIRHFAWRLDGGPGEVSSTIFFASGAPAGQVSRACKFILAERIGAKVLGRSDQDRLRTK